MFPVLRQARHIVATVEVIVHRSGAAIEPAVDEPCAVREAEDQRTGPVEAAATPLLLDCTLALDPGACRRCAQPTAGW